MKAQKGFTLVELLVVIAIIGILAAIAIPQFNKYKREGARAQAESDLRNCVTEATALYALNDTDNLTCTDVPGNLFSETVVVEANGNVTIDAQPVTVTYRGIDINCTMGDNSRVNCTIIE